MFYFTLQFVSVFSDEVIAIRNLWMTEASAITVSLIHLATRNLYGKCYKDKNTTARFVSQYSLLFRRCVSWSIKPRWWVTVGKWRQYLLFIISSSDGLIRTEAECRSLILVLCYILTARMPVKRYCRSACPRSTIISICESLWLIIEDWKYFVVRCRH